VYRVAMSAADVTLTTLDGRKADHIVH
jgi:hypothetical protein